MVPSKQRALWFCWSAWGRWPPPLSDLDPRKGVVAVDVRLEQARYIRLEHAYSTHAADCCATCSRRQRRGRRNTPLPDTVVPLVVPRNSALLGLYM